MFNARETLVQFLGEALAVKRERLCAFASKPKSQHKFFDELFHRFGSYVASSVTVQELPACAWSSPALAFVGPREFGKAFDSLREAWETVDRQQGALVISADGRFGVWCDHHRSDEKVYIALVSGVA